jgi:hypothetical protein
MVSKGDDRTNFGSSVADPRSPLLAEVGRRFIGSFHTKSILPVIGHQGRHLKKYKHKIDLIYSRFEVKLKITNLLTNLIG